VHLAPLRTDARNQKREPRGRRSHLAKCRRIGRTHDQSNTTGYPFRATRSESCDSLRQRLLWVGIAGADSKALQFTRFGI
jgi:hypothetical protein